MTKVSIEAGASRRDYLERRSQKFEGRDRGVQIEAKGIKVISQANKHLEK